MPEQIAQSSAVPSGAALAAPRNPNPWWRRIRFWRAIAGMGLAAAIAAFIVLVELSNTLAARTNRYLHHVAVMNQTLSQLKHHLISIEHRNAAAAQRESTDDILKRIIAAPDARMVRLGGIGPESNVVAATSFPPPSGALVASDTIGSAILQVAGFPAPGKNKLYRLWWQQKRKPDVLAAEFTPASDGKATVRIPIPPKDTSTITLTLEPTPETQHPTGPAILKGHLTPPPSH
jgi:anti-sigma-K factor RskA